MAQFEKGNPGGPGRPIGSRNKAYARYDEIMRESTEEALRSIGAKATKGDLPSARLVFGRLWPRARGQVVATGEVSVSPQPCERMQPVTAFQRSATAPCSAMPPATHDRSFEKSTLSKPGVCRSPLKSVLTP